MKKERIESIYFLRIFAMVMVVLVHVSAAYVKVLTEGTGMYEAYHFINRIIRIEAGIFIMLTAMVFFYKYIDQKMDKQELFSYFRKRALYIVVPYFLWALFYEAFSIYLGVVSTTPENILTRVFTGDSFYHLHFIFLIVQFYLFFPVVLYAAQKSAFFRKYMWLFGMILQVGYYFFNREFQVFSFNLFMTSMGPYLLGAWIGAYYKQQKTAAFSRTTPIWAVGGLFAGLTTVYLHGSGYQIFGAQLPTWGYLIINMLFLVVGSYAMFRIAERLVVKWPVALSYVKNIAVYSFGFYLLHPFVLKIYEFTIPIPAGNMFHAAIIVRLAATLLSCYVIIWLSHRYLPFAGLFFGKLPNKKPGFFEGNRSKGNKSQQETGKAIL